MKDSNRIVAVCLGIVITFAGQGLINRHAERNEVKSSLMLVKNELQDNLSFKQCIAPFSERNLRAFGNFLLYKEKF